MYRTLLEVKKKRKKKKRKKKRKEKKKKERKKNYFFHQTNQSYQILNCVTLTYPNLCGHCKSLAMIRFEMETKTVNGKEYNPKDGESGKAEVCPWNSKCDIWE